MKTKLLILFTLTFYVNTFSQFGSQNIITTNAVGASSVFAIDIDGDGDIDVLSASYGDDTVAWYENLDGLGNFSAMQIISSNANGANSVYAIDIDGDGDKDVLSASVQDDTIAWYSNTDGQGSFGPKQIITTIADGANTVYAADIDGDSDIDVLSSSMFDNKIAWYENLDGLGSFSAQKIISTDTDQALCVYSCDIDNDGDVDVLSASLEDDKIAWFKNNGSGVFSSQQIITTVADGATSVFSADIDQDGDFDVLSSSVYDGKIAWYENTDGQGSFGPQQIISTYTNTPAAYSVYASDLDADGDLDVLSASHIDDKIAWYKNTDGQGSFSSQHIITTNADKALSVYAADLNGDSLIDVLSASFDDNKIAWYENPDNLGVNQNSILTFSVYPNPVTDILNIKSGINIIQLEIYNQLGQLILFESDTNSIDISNLNQGVYFVKVTDEIGNKRIEKVFKQ